MIPRFLIHSSLSRDLPPSSCGLLAVLGHWFSLPGAGFSGCRHILFAHPSARSALGDTGLGAIPGLKRVDPADGCKKMALMSWRQNWLWIMTAGNTVA